MTTAQMSKVGLVGLGVMGENLALNIEEKGFPITVHNRTVEQVGAFLARHPGKRLVGARTPEELVASLERPRRVILMVKAGAAVDATLDKLAPLLEPGDILVDGGNEHFRVTETRMQKLAARGLHLVGMGVSGGEEGARHGPSLMPGGTRDAYAALEPILVRVAAQAASGPCVGYMGPGGAGHYVKMVHNGIEYGIMQLLAEAYDVLHHAGGLENAEIARALASWSQEEMDGFLAEITVRVLRERDADTGKDLVDVIVDTASMKGTGTWTVQDAGELGVPVPTISAAVEARMLSARRELRTQAADVLRGPERLIHGVDKVQLLADVRSALYASVLCSYAQGMDLLSMASVERSWGLQRDEIARVWTGGCIIRARVLTRIRQAYAEKPLLPHLLLDGVLASELAARDAGLRRVVSLGAHQGVALPATAASLAYYDGLRRARSPANLIAAQRDLFGAHKFERLDRPGTFHHDWDGAKR